MIPASALVFWRRLADWVLKFGDPAVRREIFQILLAFVITGIGGLALEPPRGWHERIKTFIDIFPSRIDEYENLLTNNRIWMGRTKGIGVLSKELAIAHGCSGPMLRGSGIEWDLRKKQPYAVYDRVDFDIPVGVSGDAYSRYLVRVEEMRQSNRIIKQCIEWLRANPGPVITDNFKVASPPRESMKSNMEELIHHFKLFTEGFRVPPGEVYYPIESPRGELACFVRSDGSSKPARVHMRDPSFVNLQALAPMAKGSYIADMIAATAMLDPILGGIDR